MTDTDDGEVVLDGFTISPGMVAGRVCMFNDARHSDLPAYSITRDAVERERNRFATAVNIAGARLDRLIDQVREDVGEAEAEIFVAQKRILQDPGVIRQINEDIAGHHRNAEAAIGEVFDVYEGKLRRLDSDYISERASDLGELKRRLLDVLRGDRPSLACAGTEECQHGYRRVVCATELSPGMTVDLDTEHILGFVTERGGINSHAGILARSLGIPAISGIGELFEHVRCGVPLLLDGEHGRVVVNPSEDRLAELPLGDRPSVALRTVEPIPLLRVAANITGPTDAERARTALAEGVGLYRTEMEPIVGGRLLDEDEQYASYARVMEVMSGQPVTFRLFDFGSDKPLPGLELPREDNPALGLRGARLLEHFPELLRGQARAVARAAALGPARLLYPMIVDLRQFVGLRERIREAVTDLPAHDLQHGVMFEVPAACLGADEILAEADFGSVGSNDLSQYLFAADRDNHLVYHCADVGHDGFWRILEMVVAAARRHAKPLYFCGELPPQDGFLDRLVAIGIDGVSADPGAIADIRERLSAGGR